MNTTKSVVFRVKVSDSYASEAGCTKIENYYGWPLIAYNYMSTVANEQIISNHINMLYKNTNYTVQLDALFHLCITFPTQGLFFFDKIPKNNFVCFKKIFGGANDTLSCGFDFTLTIRIFSVFSHSFSVTVCL